MFDLRGRESFGESVGNHIIGGTIDKGNGAAFNDPANEMKANINVLRTCVVTMVLGKRNGRLVVRIDGGREERHVEELRKEGA